MLTLEIENDIYSYLLSKTQHFGESASSILRRELKLKGSDEPTKEPAPFNSHELSAVLSNPKMRFGNTTDKFLLLLGEAYRQRPNEFKKVLSLQGRDRRYFALSHDEIANSGTSTFPKQIPGSPYWVMTNSQTGQKKRMLRQVLQLLEFSGSVVTEAVNAV